LIYASTIALTAGITTPSYRRPLLLDFQSFVDAFCSISQQPRTMTSVRVERLPWTIVEPDRKRSVNWQRAARAKITGRVANFRAHQRRFMREREDYAAAQWRRTLLRAKG
jgi:hypothetical protein